MSNKKNNRGVMITLAAASAAAVSAGLLMIMNLKKEYDKSKKTVRLISPDGEKRVLVEYGPISHVGGATRMVLTAERGESRCLCRSFLSASVYKSLICVWRDNDNLTIHFPNADGEKIASVCFDEDGCTKINFIKIRNGVAVSEDVLTKK